MKRNTTQSPAPRLQVGTFEDKQTGERWISATLGGNEIFNQTISRVKYDTDEKEQNLICFVATQIKGIIEEQIKIVQAGNKPGLPDEIFKDLKSRLN